MAALAGSLGSSVPVVAACPVHWNQYLKQILAASGDQNVGIIMDHPKLWERRGTSDLNSCDLF